MSDYIDLVVRVKEPTIKDLHNKVKKYDNEYGLHDALHIEKKPEYWFAELWYNLDETDNKRRNGRGIRIKR